MQAAFRTLSALFGCCVLVLCCVVRSDAQSESEEARNPGAELDRFIAYMVTTHGFDGRDLRVLFSKVQPSPGVTRAISAPSTAKPWYEFKPLFVDQARITAGVKYWSENAELLTRARNEFGVPEPVIVALIGIESRFGRQVGTFRVMDTLATLAFHWPGRNEFFRGELEQFLLLCREQGWDPLQIKGSFAGAMGLPQFMPGSYRRLAVDFDRDGRVDLWSNTADVIGSVAGYLRNFGWKGGEPVVAPARFDSGEWHAFVDLGIKPSMTLEQWKMRGVESMDPLPTALSASLFSLDLVGGAELWLGFDNFYALFMYNRSKNYAMAVHQLSIELVRERERLAAIESATAR